MTYVLQFVAREVPANDAEVFVFLEEVAGNTVSMAPSQQLKSLRDAVLKLFPCLTSYQAGDAGIDDCPWADGPLGDNFKGGFGSLAIARRHGEVIPHLLRIANDLGVTVVDAQERAVHRPQAYQVVLEGPLEGVEVEVAATRLAELMNQPLPQMVLLLHSRRRTLVKKGLTRAQAEIYVNALRERASCRATVTPEPRKPAAKTGNVRPPAQAAQPSAGQQPAHGGIEADDDMFKAAEAQRMSAMAVAGGIALLALAAVRIKSPFLVPGLVATGVLGAMASAQLGQALGSGALRKLLFALLALVPGVGTLLLAWTYFRAAGVLQINGITSSAAMPGAALVRELGGLPERAMLPSTRNLLALSVLAVLAAAVFMPYGH